MKKLLSVLFLLSFTLASVYAQNIQVKGTVVSGSDNEPLPGVNVVVKGTTNGGITDLEGNPYVVPMNFGYENGIIYLHSGPEGSKLEMLEHNNNVCITFSVGHKLVYQHEKVACSYSMRSESAMCRGQVEFIEEIDEKRRALDIIMRHYTDSEFNYSDPAVRNVKVWIRFLSGSLLSFRVCRPASG